ncbi:hypothetical protein HOY82DRAFT_560226 [Tuber indicum]|nr:hypothetical protein HOY82DRAFT_560226 [Tuber indicum]
MVDIFDGVTNSRLVQYKCQFHQGPSTVHSLKEWMEWEGEKLELNITLNLHGVASFLFFSFLFSSLIFKIMHSSSYRHVRVLYEYSDIHCSLEEPPRQILAVFYFFSFYFSPACCGTLLWLR